MSSTPSMTTVTSVLAPEPSSIDPASPAAPSGTTRRAAPTSGAVRLHTLRAPNPVAMTVLEEKRLIAANELAVLPLAPAQFLVQGSGRPYAVRLDESPLCFCPSLRRNAPCKHLLAAALASTDPRLPHAVHQKFTRASARASWLLDHAEDTVALTPTSTRAEIRAGLREFLRYAQVHADGTVSLKPGRRVTPASLNDLTIRSLPPHLGRAGQHLAGTMITYVSWLLTHPDATLADARDVASRVSGAQIQHVLLTMAGADARLRSIITARATTTSVLRRLIGPADAIELRRLFLRAVDLGDLHFALGEIADPERPAMQALHPADLEPLLTHEQSDIRARAFLALRHVGDDVPKQPPALRALRPR